MIRAAVSGPPPARALSRRGFAALWLLSCGHFFIDLYSIGLGTFQPLLVERLHLNLTQAGILGGALIVSSSLLQPAYGYWSDRYPTRLFTALAPALAGISISCLGLADSFAAALLLVWLGGAGIASFHPQGSAWATAGIEVNRGRWFAFFISAGTLGMALGPVYFGTILRFTSLENTWWAALPGVAATGVLLAFLRRPQTVGTAANRFDWEPLRAVWKPLVILYALVFIRSIVQVTFAQFLVLYLTRERGYSFAAATLALTIYLAAGALGGFLGGHLSDRFGGRTVILISMIGCLPFLAVFFLAQGTLALAGLALGGLFLLFTIPVNVVMAQELAPAQAGTVSALMMGFAWGTAGLIFIPLAGWASDLYSIHHTLAVLSAFPLVGFFLTFRLPRHL